MTRRQAVASSENFDFFSILNQHQFEFVGFAKAELKKYESANKDMQRKIWLGLIHKFMQEFCGFSETSYTISTAALMPPDPGANLPHVVPANTVFNNSVFFFTPDKKDDVFDSFSNINEAISSEPSFAAVQNVVITNFRTIGGYSRGFNKNGQPKEFEVWPAVDLLKNNKPTAWINLNSLAKEEEIEPKDAKKVREKLKAIFYREPDIAIFPSDDKRREMAEMMRKARRVDEVASNSRMIRGEGPLNLPIYGIDQIEEEEKKRKPAALLQVESVELILGKGAKVEKQVNYSSKLPKLDRNMLICGDNLEVMQKLFNDYGSFIDLIYIDPPFCSNRNYDSNIPGHNFGDKWQDGLTSYLPWLSERLMLMKNLLNENGSIYVHLDWHASHYVKVEMDKIFGANCFRNEIVWCYSGGATPKKEFPRKHDVILFYSKGNNWKFKTQYRPYSEGTQQRGRTAVKGKYFDQGLRSQGTPINDWWADIKKITSPTDPEKTGYPTQKSEDLVRRIIQVSSDKGDVVADFFSGSGTTAVCAQKLGRRFVVVDQNPQAVEVACDRIKLLASQNEKIGGIQIEASSNDLVRGLNVYTANFISKEKILQLKDDRSKNELSEYQHYILDCYLNNESRKLDQNVHGIRLGSVGEIPVFVTPLAKNLNLTLIETFISNAVSKYPNSSSVEILSWYVPKSIRQRTDWQQNFGVDVKFKKIEWIDIESELEELRKMVFITPAHSELFIDSQKSYRDLSVNVTFKVDVDPATNVFDINWFIFPDLEEGAAKTKYRFLQSLMSDAGNEEAEGESNERRVFADDVEFVKEYKGLKEGEYRIYCRILEKGGYVSSVIQDVRVKNGKVRLIEDVEAAA
ncbi:MAG: DNA-methyltransferase [Pseudobdellovibrionaceae bacterium]